MEGAHSCLPETSMMDFNGARNHNYALNPMPIQSSLGLGLMLIHYHISKFGSLLFLLGLRFGFAKVTTTIRMNPQNLSMSESSPNPEY